MRIILALVGIVLVLLALFSIFDLPDTTPAPAPAPAPVQATGWQAQGANSYVGTPRCMECHEEEHAKWLGSHHQLAMLPASDDSVLGDFSDSTYTYADGTTSTFYKNGDSFMVRTDGPDGELQDFAISHTFGVTPLQMYLIPFPDGRLQCLNVCWDSRPLEAGGQRWFHLYPEEVVDHEHIFHWTGRYQNWNFMCSECHSTRVEKRYDLERNRFDSRWFEVNVACESCHGPGSHHAQWADAGEPPNVPNTGLAHRMGGARLGDWHVDPVTGKPKTTQLPRNMREITICARCHSRRGILTEDYHHGAHFLQHHDLRRLSEELYFPDGQIKDEVYVLGSFLQSAMFQKGVTCSDCHDPHTAQVYSPQDLDMLCARCHAPERYDTPDHHFHPEETRCVDCHMPERTYMVVDPRRDHRFGSPRPDLSLRYGVPNACTGCHDDISDADAAEMIVDFYGPGPRDDLMPAALSAAHAGDPSAMALLTRLFEDPGRPAIIRATALDEMKRFGGPAFLESVRRAARADDPILRHAAADAAGNLPFDQRLQTIADLLADDIRAVRSAAAHALVPVAQQLPGQHSSDWKQAARDFLDTQSLNADRPEALVNAGYFHFHQGKLPAAAKTYRTSIEQHPDFIPAYANLADLLREQRDEPQSETVIRQGLSKDPDNSALHHALGLGLIRQRRYQEALQHLAKAATLAPEEPRYSYVHGVALYETDAQDAAIDVLIAAHERHPNHRDILIAIIQYLEAKDRHIEAARYRERLQQAHGDDPAIQRFLGGGR